MDVYQVIQEINRHRFRGLANEKNLQQEMWMTLEIPGLLREYRLSEKDIIDFYLPSLKLGIEVKIKGSPVSIYRQLQRYCLHQEIDHIVLVTVRTMGLPERIENKPAHLVTLGAAWL